jgi:hypothetical protein
MGPDLIAGVLIVIAFVAGLLVGAHNSKTVAADLAVAKNDIENVKSDIVDLKAKVAAKV